MFLAQIPHLPLPCLASGYGLMAEHTVVEPISILLETSGSIVVFVSNLIDAPFFHDDYEKVTRSTWLFGD